MIYFLRFVNCRQRDVIKYKKLNKNLKVLRWKLLELKLFFFLSLVISLPSNYMQTPSPSTRTVSSPHLSLLNAHYKNLLRTLEPFTSIYFILYTISSTFVLTEHRCLTLCSKSLLSLWMLWLESSHIFRIPLVFNSVVKGCFAYYAVNQLWFIRLYLLSLFQVQNSVATYHCSFHILRIY